MSERPTLIASEDVDRDPGQLLRAAEHGPAMIVENGKPTHVMVSWKAYQAMIDGANARSARSGAPEPKP